MRPVLLPLLIFPLFLFAQEAAEANDDVLVFGVMMAEEDRSALEGALLWLVRDGVRREEFRTDGSGTYTFRMEFGHVYELHCTAPRRVEKFMTIDLTTVPEEERPGGFGMQIDVLLFAEQRRKDLRFLSKEPIGRAAWDPAGGTVGWDIPYTERMKARIAAARGR